MDWVLTRHTAHYTRPYVYLYVKNSKINNMHIHYHYITARSEQ